jgi:hypothetical protein
MQNDSSGVVFDTSKLLTPPPPCPGCGMVAGAHWGDCPKRQATVIQPAEKQIQRLTSPHKGRAVKEIAHRGWKAPRKATLPLGNLRLPDGRLLVYQGTTHDIGANGAWWLTADAFKVIASMDVSRWGSVLHVSMSYPDRDPSWEDILQTRYTFYPKEIDIMMILPRDGEYVNTHTHCFQIRQCPEPWNDGMPLPKEGKRGKGK